MPALGTHWCSNCRWFVRIDGDVLCPFCNEPSIEHMNELHAQWPFYERLRRILERPVIRQAAYRGRFHLADTNREDHHHGLRRRNYTVDSSARQEPRMDDTFDSVVSQVEDDQIDHSNVNHPALPSDSSNSIGDSLQTIRITQRHVQDDLNCAICLDQFQLGHKVRETSCKHLYHYNCIIPWLLRRNSCPICRCDMLPQSTWFNMHLAEIEAAMGSEM